MTKEAGGAATLIAIAGPRPTIQKRASHIVLDICEPKAPTEKAPTEKAPTEKDGS